MDSFYFHGTVDSSNLEKAVSLIVSLKWTNKLNRWTMSNLSIFSKVFKNILRSSIRPAFASYSDKASKTSNSASEIEEFVKDDEGKKDEQSELPPVLYDPVDLEAIEQEIEQKRNKSGLLPQHRRMLNRQKPYDEAQSWVHNTLKYQRTMYGRHGEASGVDPRILFPTPQEAEEQVEFERVAFPKTLPEMIEITKQEKILQAETIRKREEDITKKLGKLDQWQRELNAKVAKREADARAAIERKERLVEEVRRQFGFKLDPKDQRFKDMLAQKEKEDKKMAKQARKKLSEEKMLAKLQESVDTPIVPEPKQSKDKKENKSKKSDG